jgi:hypothetical protein
MGRRGEGEGEEGEEEHRNEQLKRSLNPERFAGQDANELRARALSWYNDIGEYRS